ncbi:non-specific lipid transfer protein GPI-anchored 14-like isoform X1 [Arachis stenosperma]|uniref:non-specific lipid transfer protein GPI-anchored 14-like isoform X1 n=1 Tax=Arachis stenosperma TaxID=217475 RepID=UPI0025AD1574|nr:non-specific lipid transfer protein GPI-anchored 14-like isoform X1 [Arachis stenosperma]
MDSKLVLITIALILISNAMGDSAQEKQKCAEQLTNTATCLPYLGGDANAPTSDCCSGLIESLKNNKKCVCLILKDRDDPDLGLKINITLALGLPSLCKASDNFSQCPALLHLDPKSAEAQSFNNPDPNSNGSSKTPSPSPSAEGSSQNGKNKDTTETATAKNCASNKGQRSFLAGLLLWFSI